MKLIRLAAFHFTQLLRRDKLIFLLYVLGSVCCVLMFLFCYGNMTTSKRMEQSDQVELKRYTLEHYYPQAPDTGFLSSIAAYSPQYVSFSRKYVVTPEQKALSHYPICRISAFVSEETPLLPISGRVQFSKEELENGQKVIIVPSTFIDDNTGKVVLYGQEFTVIGMSSALREFYIPYKTYQALGLTVDIITIDLASQLSVRDNNALVDLLYSMIPESRIEDPSIYYSMGKDSLAGELLLVAGMYVLAFLSFTFLMKFLMDSSAHDSIVYTIVGASKKRMLAVALCGNLLLCSITSLAAIFFHVLFYSTCFAPINIVDNLTYSFQDYVLVFVLTVFFSLLTLLPFCINSYHHSITSLKQRYD